MGRNRGRIEHGGAFDSGVIADQIDRIDEARSRTMNLVADVLAAEDALKVGWLSVLLVNVPTPEDAGGSLDALLVSARAELEREMRFKTMD